MYASMNDGVMLKNKELAFVDNFVVDSDEDFTALPAAAPGSTAISPSGAVQIVNASGEWVPFGG